MQELLGNLTRLVDTAPELKDIVGKLRGKKEDLPFSYFSAERLDLFKPSKSRLIKIFWSG